MPVGYWCPVLHAHLPYVRHPEYPEFLEEDWLFEALNETYVPLVRVLDGLLRDGVDYRLTMTLSPPLVSMMTDELLIARYLRHLDRLVELSRREIERTARLAARSSSELARFYHAEFARTCAASSATSTARNLLERVPQAPRRRQARDHHLRRDPRLPAAHGPGAAGRARAGAGRGAALPQALRAATRRGSGCPSAATCPGTTVYLREVGLRFAFLESHGLTDAHPRPSFGVHAPIVVAGRDRVLRARHGVVAPGLERRVGLPGRLRLPRVLQGHRLRAADGRPRGVPARRAAQEPRHQVLPRHRPRRRPRRQAAVRARMGAREGGAARGQLPVQPPEAGRAPGGEPWAARRSW